MSYLRHIELDDSGLPDPTPEMEQERRVALFDLAERNSFVLIDAPQGGPYDLTLRAKGAQLEFALRQDGRPDLGTFSLPLDGFAQASKDYATLCASYVEAVRTLPPAGIAAIDEARRAIHNEGARALKGVLDERARVDDDTARRLFTLVAILQHY